MRNASLSPFLHNGYKTKHAMRDVIIALIPAVICSLIFFGINAAIVILISIASCVFGEFISNKIMKREVTLGDYSAILTGLLLALTLPSGIPIPFIILGSFVAIIVVKQLFGGIGCNIFNPAVAGRGFLLIAFAKPMTTWLNPLSFDGSTTSTTLTTVKSLLKTINTSSVATVNHSLQALYHNGSLLFSLVTGNVAGSLGETSAIALIIGGIYLGFKKVIHIEIPLIYISTAYLFSLIYSLALGIDPIYAIVQIFSGGLLLGAIFMATDWVTKPLTRKGRVIYAVFLGIITMLIRLFGNYPEGVLFAILVMNMGTPFIDRLTKNKIFGTRGKKNEKK